MPALDSPQFKDYAFRVKSTEWGTEAAVARIHPPGSAGTTGMLHEERPEPLGSINIYSNRGTNERGQRQINERRGAAHYVTEDPDTQQTRWAGGNMNADDPYVGWAAMSKVPGHTRLIQGVAAVAVQAHGSMPLADSSLSESGARFARGAARKYGMKADPMNPKMEEGFTSFEESSARHEGLASWVAADPRLGGKQYSAAETAQVVKNMDAQYRIRPQKTPEETHIHPDQLKLL